MNKKFFESYQPALIGDWVVKVSQLDGQIMAFVWNPNICESAIEFFDSEYEAVLWIDYMTAKYV